MQGRITKWRSCWPYSCMDQLYTSKWR